MTPIWWWWCRMVNFWTYFIQNSYTFHKILMQALYTYHTCTISFCISLYFLRLVIRINILAQACKHMQIGLLLLSAQRLASLTQNYACRQMSSAHRSRSSILQHFRQTLLSLLTQNLTWRQAPSPHRSHCSIIQCSQETLLTLLAHNQTHRQASSAQRSRCSLI